MSTDEERAEIFTEVANDKRELMVKVYYRAQRNSSSMPAPYVDGILAQALGLTPELIARIHSHAYQEIPVSQGEAKYPVIIARLA
jgi:hypothetical protein